MRLKYGKIKALLQNVAGIAECSLRADCMGVDFGINYE